MAFIYSTPVLIRHLWPLKTVVLLHWSLKRAPLLCQQVFYCGSIDFYLLVVAGPLGVGSLSEADHTDGRQLDHVLSQGHQLQDVSEFFALKRSVLGQCYKTFYGRNLLTFAIR
jgi:hypothetical protein